MKKLLFLALIFCHHFNLTAQDDFTFSDTIVYLEKTTDFFNVHWYIEIYNESDEEKEMIWEANFSPYPSRWEVSFDDQNNFYSNIRNNESNEFKLYNNPSAAQKLIIGVFHNEAIGNGQFRFKIYPKGEPEKFKYITYDITFTQPPVVQNERPMVELEIDYSMSDAEEIHFSYKVEDGDDVFVCTSAYYSQDGGLNFEKIPDADLSENTIGENIQSGRWIESVWKLSDQISPPQIIFRIVADDKSEINYQEIIDKVDEETLIEKMQNIVGVRHSTEPQFLNQVKDYLKQEIIDNELILYEQSWNNGSYNAHNYIGQKRGLVNDELIIINDAHYDTVIGSPGADDNGSGVVGVLMGMEILSDYEFTNSIHFPFFDLEEIGLVGSINYVTNVVIPEQQNILGVLNYEMIGFYDETPGAQSLPTGFNILFPDAYQQVIDGESKGDFITNVANENSNPLRFKFDSLAAQYVPELKVISLAAPGNGEITPDLARSDHAAFWNAGYQALMITDGANFRNDNYHEDSDTLGTLDFTFMSNVVKATIATILDLAKPINAGFDQKIIPIVSTVSQLHNDCKVKIHPNVVPKNNPVFIENLDCLGEKVSIKVYNRVGIEIQMLKQLNLIDNKFLLPSLESGIYYINLSSPVQTTTLKIIII